MNSSISRRCAAKFMRIHLTVKRGGSGPKAGIALTLVTHARGFHPALEAGGGLQKLPGGELQRETGDTKGLDVTHSILASSTPERSRYEDATEGYKEALQIQADVAPTRTSKAFAPNKYRRRLSAKGQPSDAPPIMNGR